MSTLQALLSIGSGSLVGFTLGLVGGGGSILAVPLLVYVVGVSSPHVAIGTSAIAVAASAALNLAGHARAQTRDKARFLAMVLLRHSPLQGPRAHPTRPYHRVHGEPRACAGTRFEAPLMLHSGGVEPAWLEDVTHRSQTSTDARRRHVEHTHTTPLVGHALRASALQPSP